MPKVLTQKAGRLIDGGDTRCLSQLIVMDECMSRLKHDLGKDIRPCEYFHSITGVGAAGYVEKGSLCVTESVTGY